MTKVRLPKSVKKYIRKEKARIRREVLDLAERERLIKNLLAKFYNQKESSAKKPLNENLLLETKNEQSPQKPIPSSK